MDIQPVIQTKAVIPLALHPRSPKPDGVRSTDMVTWEDWKTMDLEGNTCEAVDLTTGESKYFYRALEAPTETG